MSEQSVTWAAQMLESMNEEASKDGSSMSKLGWWITIGDGENCGDGDNHRGVRDVDDDFDGDVDLMKFEFSVESLMNEWKQSNCTEMQPWNFSFSEILRIRHFGMYGYI